MKKTWKIVGVILMIFTMAFTLVACNDGDDQVASTPETEEIEEQSINLPPEVQKKIDEIYSKASIGPQIVKTVQQLAILTSINYTQDGGPISITPAKLNGEEVTLITLGGTEFKEGQATTIEESTLASQGLDNDYLKALTNLFFDGTVPTGKPVLITGISLGGMIAQQIIGIQEIHDNFDIKAIITFGSPLTSPLYRYGVKIVRFTDSHDQVPQLGEMFVNMNEDAEKIKKLQEKERILETSKYTEMLETHALSYIEDECWDKYDFLGDINKLNVLELTSNMSFYPAPKIEKI